MPPVRPGLAAIAVVAAAVGLAVVYGPGYIGYDAAWALVWGEQLMSGELPDYRAPIAPTPHPLANVLAAPLSLFDDGGASALLAVSFLAFAVLLASVVVVGSRLLAWPAGVAAAIIVGTLGVLGREVAFASFDLPYLALIGCAAAAEAARPRRGRLVLVLLALAGLIRPEAWLFSVVYVLWLASDGRPKRSLLGSLLIAMSAPVVWALSDLVVAGSPLFSLTGTQSLAADLGRPTGFGTALTQSPVALREMMGTLPLLAALVALVAGMIGAPRRFAGPLIVLAGGFATFILIGAVQLPVLTRYLLLPACAFGLIAGLGLALAVRGRAWIGVTVVVGALLVAAIPQSVEALGRARDFTRARRAVHSDLLTLATVPAFRSALDHCPSVHVPDFRARPLLLLGAPDVASRLTVGNLPDGQRGLVLTYASEQAARVFTLGVPGEVRRQAAPAGGRLVAANRSWVAYAVC